MSIPSNFGGTPKEDPNHHFRNVCKEFIKMLKSSTDIELLELHMDRFINVAKQMHWNHEKSDRFHKDESEKAANRVVKEFRKYIQALKADEPNNSPQNVINALAEVESMIRSFKVV